MRGVRSLMALVKSIDNKFWTLAFILVGTNFLMLWYQAPIKQMTLDTKKRNQVSVRSESLVNGVALAEYVASQCRKLNSFPFEFEEQFWIKHMHILHAANTLYCPVEKVGTTFWRRVLFLHSHMTRFKHPLAIPIDTALSQKYEKVEANKTSELENMYKFLFVRDPYRRLLSAYVDKIYVPNPMFWGRFGEPAITQFRQNHSDDHPPKKKCYHDATFSEFLQFVAWSETTREKLDGHFQKASEMCVACSMNFTFIGKMESFKEDAFDILRHLNMGDKADAMAHDMSELTAVDAIRDSIISPFHWKGPIMRCMGWQEALLRIWRKLQIRGLIGLEQKLPGEPGKRLPTSSEEFIKLALKARAASDVVKLKQQKTDAFIDMYRDVPIEVLEHVRTAYSSDFYLFDYDESPDELFDRSASYVSKHYSNFRKLNF